MRLNEELVTKLKTGKIILTHQKESEKLREILFIIFNINFSGQFTYYGVDNNKKIFYRDTMSNYLTHKIVDVNDFIDKDEDLLTLFTI